MSTGLPGLVQVSVFVYALQPLLHYCCIALRCVMRPRNPDFLWDFGFLPNFSDRESGLGTRDSGVGTRESGVGTRVGSRESGLGSDSGESGLGSRESGLESGVGSGQWGALGSGESLGTSIKFIGCL
jgi:hypothetical protein